MQLPLSPVLQKTDHCPGNKAKCITCKCTCVYGFNNSLLD